MNATGQATESDLLLTIKTNPTIQVAPISGSISIKLHNVLLRYFIYGVKHKFIKRSLFLKNIHTYRCVCTCTHVHTHTHAHKHTHTYIHTQTHTHTHTNIHKHIYTHKHVHTCNVVSVRTCSAPYNTHAERD